MYNETLNSSGKVHNNNFMNLSNANILPKVLRDLKFQLILFIGQREKIPKKLVELLLMVISV